MSEPYMNDYFFSNNNSSKFKHAKSYSNLNSLKRHSSLNLSGSEIVYNNSNINNNKNSITSYLKQDNMLAHKQLDEINNEYNNMKNFLNDKVSKFEQQQQMQFDTLRNYLEENNLRENLESREKYKNNIMNEIKSHIDCEMNRKKNIDKIRDLDYKERIGRKLAKEKQEREQLLREMDYVEKIKRLDQMEKMILHKNLMNKKIQEMYNSIYYPNPYNFPGYPPFMSPLFFEMMNAYNNNNKHNEIMKLYLLKSLFDEDKPKKDPPFIMKPPKYLIQKYYPPAPNTNYIPVPQPILFKSPDFPKPPIIPEEKEKPIIKVTLPKDESVITRTSYESIPTPQKRRHKHKRKHKHRHRHKQRNETPSEESEEEPEEKEDEEKEEKPNNEEEEEPEKGEEEKEKESEKKDKEEDDSSEPDVRLKLYDPDNPEDDKIVYPSRNPN